MTTRLQRPLTKTSKCDFFLDRMLPQNQTDLMIVYLSSKAEFNEDVISNRIDDKILDGFHKRLGHSVGASEVASWRNSLNFMNNVLGDKSIPDDTGIAIEYRIPNTSKRIDMVLTGEDGNRTKTAVIVELKQWSEASETTMDGIVRTFLGGCIREVGHPSYQAWSYAALLEDFNEAVREEPVRLQPCAYLHNCTSGKAMRSDIYKEHISKAPIFLKEDAAKLAQFISEHVKYGDNGDAMYVIQSGKIRPSKNLSEMLVSLLQGNKEFLMIDDQKIVYEKALELTKQKNGTKEVLIVEGGPGTGKSVVAINLLVELTRCDKVVQYVTKNAAPRTVYEAKLTGTMAKSRISNLFKGSGAYIETQLNSFDVLVVDEAHRLNAKSGLFRNKGENQIKEIIKASRLSVFFIDENQRVTLHDIGSKSQVLQWAKKAGANVTELELASQFRCNGSDGYLAWVDNTLQVRKTANTTLEGVDYQLEVCGSAGELRDKIFTLNKERNSARMVAGYCWDWISKKNGQGMDITFPDEDFAARWNLSEDGSLWILKPETVNEVGCIHTCQGLELDYVGVIIGKDFVVRNGKALTNPDERSSMDNSIKGHKKMRREDPERAATVTDEIIKNTYRTLMTRGQRGCFIYCVDKETLAHFKNATGKVE